MKPFTHVQAAALDEAVELLESHDAVPLAGGTDILNALKIRSHPSAPDLLVDLTRIPGLDGIDERAGGLRVGALAKIADIEHDALVRERVPMLSQAAHAVASPQLRNMGTLGGNLCQEPRCWYYRYPDNAFHCMRKGGKDCPARNGESRFHSIFGAAPVTAPPCRVACPGHTDIPGFLAAVRAGALSEAAALFLEVNPMPGITGRVCPHFCQSDCNRSRFDDSVSIRNVERFVGDHILKHAVEYYHPPRVETGRRVAIVGSGPAGLSAAYFLRKSGHQVVVFEAAACGGGMLRGIPKYRLPSEVTEQACAALERMGIRFVLNTRIGSDIALDDLRREHEAVLLTTGMWAERSIGVPGEDLAIAGIAYLTADADAQRSVSGKRIAVIGGGNVAMDVAVTARRRGAAEVTVVYRRQLHEMPAYKEEIAQAIEEGVKIATGLAPVRITADSAGARTLELVRSVSAPGASRGPELQFDACATETLQADEVVLAVGQSADLSFLGEHGALAARGLVATDAQSGRTGLAGLYAAGDVAIGPDSVIGAIAEGRKAAEAIERQFGGAGAAAAAPAARKPASARAAGTAAAMPAASAVLGFEAAALSNSQPVFATMLSVAQRTADADDTVTLGDPQAVEESSRCFNCGCVATSPSDLAPALIALNAMIRTTKRAVAAEHFFHAGVMTSTILDPGEIVTSVEIPAPESGGRQAFFKQSARGAIDFAQVSVAVVLSMADGAVRDARIVLGGVAPVPWRSTAAEQALRGAPLTEESAARAGEAAIREAVPLAGNAYMTRIVATAVKRTVLAAR
jgi:NADPH-dependent glutamate synthase beta subunit-like oxidoreductase/CO/xanthine dehydrogenase FAD-binding subunit